MVTNVIQTGHAKNITATDDVTKINTELIGFYVNSTTAGTMVLRSGGAGGPPLGGIMTPSAGYNPYPCFIAGGLHCTVGGTIDVTFFYLPSA